MAGKDFPLRHFAGPSFRRTLLALEKAARMQTVFSYADFLMKQPSYPNRPRAHVLRILLSVAWGLGYLVTNLPAAPTHLERGQPEEVGLRSEDLQRIDPLVQQGLDDGRMPGCVVAIGRHGKLVFLKAYGNRQLQPDAEPMTTDTVFDLASLTKPIATATSAMLLVQRGQLRLQDRVAEYWPEFGAAGKDQITIGQLMTHHSGLIADNPIADFDLGSEQAMARICAYKTRWDPASGSSIRMWVSSSWRRSSDGLPGRTSMSSRSRTCSGRWA